MITIVFVDIMTYTSYGIQWYTLFCLKLLRFVWIKTCLYFFYNDVIMFEYDYICMFDTAIVRIFAFWMGMGFSLLCCSVPNHVMYFVVPFQYSRNVYIDKYVLWKFCMDWCLFWWGCVVFRSRFPLEEGGNCEYGWEISFL